MLQICGMGFFSFIPDLFKKEAPDQLMNYLQLMGFVNPYFIKADGAEEAIKNGYLQNADIYSIVELITKTAAQVGWKLYEVVDEKQFQRFKSLGISDYDTALKKLYGRKALEETQNDIVSEALMRPNDLQTWNEFVQNVLGFKLITGNAFVQGYAPVGRNYFSQLWVLPTQDVTIVPGDRRQIIEGYNVGYINNQIPFEEVMHLRYWNPQYKNGQMLYGLSPLQAAYHVLTLSNSNDLANIKSSQNIGAVGILHPENDLTHNPQGETAFSKLKTSWQKFFAGAENRGKILATSAKVRWQQIGLSPVDLNIIESQNMNLRRLCNVYGGVPSQLLNDPANKTYNNQTEAEKALMTRIVLPALMDLCDELNAWWIKGISAKIGKQLYLGLDTNSIPVLQPNLEILSKRLIRELNAGVWTRNETRIMLGGDEVDRQEMNEFFVTGHYSKIGEANEQTVQN